MYIICLLFAYSNFSFNVLSSVTSRNYPTVIAFNVMKLTIDADSGVVTPHAKTGLHSHPVS